MPNIMTRSLASSTMQPKRELMGLNVYEIIKNGNLPRLNFQDIKSYKKLKRKISKSLNSEYEPCTKVNCISCTYNYSRFSTMIKT